ncbi:MAG: hypothetical protein K9M15_01775 [Candidatus Marinimicrobia bacterium]|nr:hypothetical protein [Candidatus Neomarinimicrobiota bacterium]
MQGDNLKKLKKRLYKKGESFEDRVRDSDLMPPIKDVKTYWDSGGPKSENRRQEIKAINMSRKKSHKSLIFWGIASFFLFVLVVAGVVFYFLNFGIGGNVISSKKIDIEIEGPLTVNSGEDVKWRVTIVNNNEVSLELSDLIIEYPEGTLMLESEPVSSERRSVGAIFPGEKKTEEVHIAILGNENEQKEIEFTLEYRLEKSNAIFSKTEKQIIKLARSPVGISLNMPDEIESGQIAKIGLEYVSNSELVLENVYLKMEYPPGFNLKESSLAPEENDNIWKVGDIEPGEKNSLEITGLLEGVDMTELGFRAFVGMLDKNGEFVSFESASDSIFLKKPFVNFSFLINEQSLEVLPYSTKQVRISVFWKNNLPTEIRNNNIKVILKSEAIDFKTLTVNKGYYKSYDDSITWNSSSFPELASIAPGKSGSATFSFELKDSFLVQSARDKNFVFTIEGEMSGTRVSEGGQSILVKSVSSKEVKLTSEVNFSASLLSSSEYFSNTGPIPPQVGKETKYTVVWSISNFYNDLSGVSVRSSLPSYVKWLGVVSPSGEDIAYKQDTGELIWNVGGVSAGSGLLNQAKTVAFQIAFLPSVSQEGSSPVLIPRMSLGGIDSFTGTAVEDYFVDITSASTPEAQSNFIFGKVVGP